MSKLYLYILFIITSVSIQAQSLTQRLDSLLNDPLLKTSEVGLAVFDLQTGEQVYQYQDE